MMINLNTMITKRLNLTQSTPVGQSASSDTQSFDDVLAATFSRPDLTAPATSTIQTSTLPPNVLTIVQSVIEGEPMTEAQLNKASRILQAVAGGIINLANQTIAPEQTKQLDFDLEIVVIGSLNLLTHYGYKPAIKDIVKLIRSIDSRSECFSTLKHGLTDLIKTKSFDLCDPNKSGDKKRSNSEKLAITYDIQYSLWEALSVIKGDTQTKTILGLFDQYNSMISAKVDIDGTPVDSLVESGNLTEESTLRMPTSAA